MSKIHLTGKQIRLMASFAGYVVAEFPDDMSMDDSDYILEMDVDVDGVKEDFFLSNVEYPEEGGSVLREQPQERTQE